MNPLFEALAVGWRLTIHRWAAPTEARIDREPPFGYRTVAGPLGFNKNTVHRFCQLCGWQVRKRDVGHRPRVEVPPSVAARLNEGWARDLRRMQAGAIGDGGELFVLDTGEPVRIANLAPDLIRLSGYEERTDIELRFKGLRLGKSFMRRCCSATRMCQRPRIRRSSGR